jgi:hypothetical protein
MNQFTVQNIKQSLKIILKQKHIRFEDIAKELDCSIPTVKRILGPEELSLSRLLQLCDFVGLGLGELESFAATKLLQRPGFTAAQQDFLAKHPSHFAYLMRLYAGSTPAKIAQEFSLNMRTTDKYLLDLERTELIRVTGKQKIKLAYATPPHWGTGPLAKLYYDGFIRSGAEFFTDYIGEVLNKPNDEINKENSGFTLKAIKVSKESYRLWRKEQMKRHEDFERLASFEEKTRSKSELMTAVVLDAGALVSNDYSGLKKFENILGKVKQL